MAIATYPVTLKTGATYAAATKLLDIKSFPDLGGAPEQIETTTLSDAAKTYIQGIQDQQALEFTANYTKTDLDAVNALDTETIFWLEFGTAGAGGIFTIDVGGERVYTKPEEFDLEEVLQSIDQRVASAPVA